MLEKEQKEVAAARAVLEKEQREAAEAAAAAEKAQKGMSLSLVLPKFFLPPQPPPTICGPAPSLTYAANTHRG